MRIKTNEILFPEITKYHVELMLHAIGLDDESPKRSRTGEYYYPYRNYYDVSESKEWEELVEMGYARKSSDAMYHVTNSGLCMLFILTNVKIYSPAARYEATTIREVFGFLCEADVFCGYGCWLPVSCGYCATCTNIPLHKVRKAMRTLIELGYACKTHYSDYDDNSLRPIYTRGYGLTEKARETEIHKRAREKEVRRIEAMMAGRNEDESNI